MDHDTTPDRAAPARACAHVAGRTSADRAARHRDARGAPTRKASRCVTVACLLLLLSPLGAAAGDDAPGAPLPASAVPRWTAAGELVLPENHRHWVFLGSPLTPNGLNGGQAGFPEFHNVYIHPEALRRYQRDGAFAEGTILVKELQLTRPGDGADGSGVEASGRGYFPGTPNGIDIAVKDSARFAATGGWGFFNFGHHAPPYAATAAAAPAAACADCHAANATKEMVFSKFYAPILDAE
ncbi:MAG: cytochrome P460 family protein [Gammaproteobacteria bacterium]|nr:cytochrome P460 family protein [Gammaproteobacteria bacterium]MCP5199540.1 cytochrome P460 family protein [Gammaproteobacteria bacterium]